MEQFEQLVTLMEKNQIATLKKRLGGMNATDVAAFLENLDPEKRLLVFRVLPEGSGGGCVYLSARRDAADHCRNHFRRRSFAPGRRALPGRYGGLSRRGSRERCQKSAAQRGQRNP